jgi:hypothetical protein
MRQSAEHEQIVTVIDSAINNYGRIPLGGARFSSQLLGNEKTSGVLA